MKITFIGVSSCIPDVGSETSSFLIDAKILVDTGWCGVLKMREYNLDPLDLEYLILTHFHQDHYLGLPQLLFYLGIKKLNGAYFPRKPFTIIGPSKHLNEVVTKAQEFMQIKEFPELSLDLKLVSLSPGQSYVNRKFRLDTFPARHLSGKNIPEEAFICKFTEIGTNKFFTFTGDTSFYPPLVDFAKESLLFIHDACHSSPKEAATIAKMARVKKLYLIHYPRNRKKEIITKARKIFPKSFLAREGGISEI
ncbi:MAG: MBL fold metallo-hydrolase [Candidatus Omnitrophota bacterium]